MSGGSYDYLYLKAATDAVDPDMVERMVERLNGIGCYGAANMVRRYYNPPVNELPAEVIGLMHAIEWIDSGDGADLDAAIAAYREAHVTPEWLEEATTTDAH